MDNTQVDKLEQADQQLKQKRTYVKRKEGPRKEREEKKPYRNSVLTRKFLEQNEGATDEQIIMFRKVYNSKRQNIYHFTKKHPELKGSEKKIINDLPIDIEKLKKFRIKDWLKTNNVKIVIE